MTIKMNLGIVRDYKLLQVLGKGSFGVTYLAYDMEKSRYVAIKTINMDIANEFELADIFQEIDALIDLSKETPKYMVNYYDNFDAQFDGFETKFIVSEYIEGVSLLSFIRSNPGTLAPSYLWPIMTQLILGLKYIHDRGYAHRDIKPENILIKANYEIKYIDFGCTCFKKHQNTFNHIDTCKGLFGTQLYMPPEQFLKTSGPGLFYSQAHDIWSLTVVFYLLAQGPNNFPFFIKDEAGNDIKQLDFENNIINSPQTTFHYIYDIDSRTQKFIEKLLITDPYQRPTINKVLSIFTDEILLQVWD